MCVQVFLVFNSCSVHNCLSLPYFAFNRGIPPWDTVNTLYIEREEITGIVYLLVNLSYCLSVMIFSILESYFFLITQAIENFFSVCIAWYKHERGWENTRQLCKPKIISRGFAEGSRLLPTPWMFTSGYANAGKKFSIAFIK